MFSPKFLLLFGVLLAILLDPISGRKGSHSYPRSGGLSGGGHRTGSLSGGGHGYPSSSGSHGYPSSSGSHGYPSNSGMSGGGHGYPSSGSNSYPSQHPPSGTNRGYPSPGGSHTYPSSGSGSHGYPGGGLSGHGSTPNKPGTTNIHHHYHYTPPQQIRYTPVGGGPPVNYPVYRGQPPNYVYQYKDSGSKYGTLLAGLALMNLGTLGVAAYALHNSNNGHGGSSGATYKPQPGEVCLFAVKKENGDYEETRIDCQIISGFILQEQATNPTQNSGTNSTVITTTTVTNVTTVNMPNAPAPDQTTTEPPKILYEMLANGALVPVNVTAPNVNVTAAVPNDNMTALPNGTMTSSVTVTTTTTNTTQVNALDVKGKPVEVTPGMQCFIIRKSPVSNMRKTVPCGVLQTYAEKSIQRNSATHHAPMFTVVAAILAYCVAY